MPVIEYNSSGETFQLKSAPPDGYIKARALSYDEVLTRRDLAARYVYRQQNPTSKPASNGTGIGAQKNSQPTEQDVEMMMEASNKVVQRFQFGAQIIDHNLEFPGGVKINFANEAHLRKLPPKLGAEIEDILDKLNEQEEETAEADFPEPSTTSSSPAEAQG